MGQPWETCKPWRGSQPLCERFDPDIVEHLHDKSITSCERVHDMIRNGLAAASIHVDAYPFPASVEDFQDAICALHEMIFAEGLPQIAGRYRQPGEEIEFGGEGAHRICGVAPELIADRVDALYVRILAPEHFRGDGRQVADACAFFLEEFFRIHPFKDGNGRVGRLIIRWACIAWSRYRFKSFATTPRRRRAYRKALEYAHRYVHSSVHHGKAYKPTPFVYLSRWLLEHLEEMPTDTGLEAEPPAPRAARSRDTPG